MEVTHSYKPRPHQEKINRNFKRFNVLVCHRRFGKTVMCINNLIADAISCEKENPRFAYMSPFYRQAKLVAWDYLKHYTSNIPGTTYNESELRVNLPNGAKVMLYGADNYDALRGIYLDGVVLDEYAQMSPKAWTEVIRPALTDREGWAIFVGTPMGHNSFYDMYQYAEHNKDWYSVIFKASDTNIISKEELLLAKATMGPDEYEQEFECSFTASILGSFYSDYILEAREQGRICKLPYDKNLPVHTAWDIGHTDSTCICFFQTLGKEIRIIDFYEEIGSDIGQTIDMLAKKKYDYGTHHVPHDFFAKSYQTGRSTCELAEEYARARSMSFEARRVPRLKSSGELGEVLEGIRVVRSIFNRLYFDTEKCYHLIECLTQYRKEYDEDKKVFKARPLHDWTSHAADSLRYLAVGFEDSQPEPQHPSRYHLYQQGKSQESFAV